MDQITFVKKQFRMEQWKQRILECQASGMTVRSWCKQQGVAEQTYYRYLKILRQELSDKPLYVAVFSKDFKEFVHSDGHSGYNKLTGITRCGCWVHLIRKFIEAIPKKAGTSEPLTNAEIGRDYCNQLFEIERDPKHLSPEDHRLKRLELEKPILEAFWCWLEKLNVLNGSALGKTVTYAKNQRKYGLCAESAYGHPSPHFRESVKLPTGLYLFSSC